MNTNDIILLWQLISLILLILCVALGYCNLDLKKDYHKIMKAHISLLKDSNEKSLLIIGLRKVLKMHQDEKRNS